MIYSMVPFSVTLSDPWPRFQGHGVIFRPMNALNVLYAQLTRDLFAIAKFLFCLCCLSRWIKLCVMLCINAACAVVRCLCISVCLSGLVSVTFVYCVETAKIPGTASCYGMRMGNRTKLTNDTIFSDNGWLLTQISRAHHQYSELSTW